MSLNEEEESKLESWITDELEKLMQSNAEDLSQYVVSIVKNNKDADTLRSYFLTDLRTFLKGDTPVFVNKLMNALAGNVILVLCFREGRNYFIVSFISKIRWELQKCGGN